MAEVGGESPVEVPSGGSGVVADHMKVQLLVRAFQVRGHHIAKLDPLGFTHADQSSEMPSELTLEHYGWSASDLTKEFELGPGILPRFKQAGIEKMKLGEIIDACKNIYCEHSAHSPERTSTCD